jgi:hypothetical protein
LELELAAEALHEEIEKLACTLGDEEGCDRVVPSGMGLIAIFNLQR